MAETTGIDVSQRVDSMGGARGVSVFEFGIFFARSQIDRDDATPGGKSVSKSVSKFLWWFSWLGVLFFVVGPSHIFIWRPRCFFFNLSF